MGVLRREPSGESEIQVHDVHTILGPESSFDGKLLYEGTVRIDGKFAGEVHSSGSLVVGEGAHVKAHVRVGHLVIHGEVEGELVATESMEIHAPAKVRGSIQTPELMVAKGVLFEGSCNMLTKTAPGENVTPLLRGHKD